MDELGEEVSAGVGTEYQLAGHCQIHCPVGEVDQVWVGVEGRERGVEPDLGDFESVSDPDVVQAFDCKPELTVGSGASAGAGDRTSARSGRVDCLVHKRTGGVDGAGPGEGPGWVGRPPASVPHHPGLKGGAVAQVCAE